MRTSIIVLLVTILAAALLGILAYIRYRRRLNEALSDSSDPSIRQHSSASPAEFVPWLLIALLVIWNAVTLGKVSSMSARLDNMSNNLQSQMMLMNSRISDLEEMLKKENAILRSYDWSFSEFDAESHCVFIDFTLYPQSYTETTRLSLTCGSETVSFSQSSPGIFKGSAKVDIFKMIEDFPALTMTDGGTSRVQILDDMPIGYLFDFYLPIYMADASTLKTARKGDTLKMSGELHLSQAGKDTDVRITKAELLKEVNGVVKESVPVTLRSNEMTTLNLDESFADFGRDSTLRLLLRAETDTGYTVQTLLVTVEPENNDNPTLYHGDVEIFNAAGESLLHRKE